MEKNIPTYKISDDQALSENGEFMGIDEVAYTATPAIMTKGIAFNSVQPTEKMRFADTLKMRVAAPALIPDVSIYRKDDDLGEYNVVFTKERIESLYNNFMKRKGANPFNLDHTNQKTESYILESWITGPSATDRSFTKYGVECPEGSVFIVSQFTDADYFQKEIIEKGRTGYSIEGFLGLELSQIIKEQFKKTKMEKQKFEKQILEDGTPVFISNGEAFIIDDNGDKAPIFDGEHKLKDGSIIETVGGKITEKEIESPIEAAKTEEKPVEEKPVACAESPIPAVAEEKKDEEKMADEPVAEKPVDAPVATPDEAAILAVVQPKLDELMKAIADLKTLVETSDVPVDIEMNKAKFTNVAKPTGVDTLASFFKNVDKN